jgi:PKD repeat protein
MKQYLLTILSVFIIPLAIFSQNADFGDAPDNQKWWGGTAVFPTLRASTGPMHTQASQSTYWIGNKSTRGANTTTEEQEAKLINKDLDDGRPHIFILLVSIPAPADITVPITTSSSHNPNTQIYVNVAIDVDNDLDFNDTPDMNWVVRNQIVQCPADTTLGFNFGPFGFGNDLLLLPVWVRVTLTDVPISSPWNGSGIAQGWTGGETEDWYFGSKGARGHNSRKANNPPSDSLPPDSIPPKIPQSDPDPEKCVQLIYPRVIYIKCDQEKCIWVGVKDCGDKPATDIKIGFTLLKGTELKVPPRVVGVPILKGKTTWFRVCATGWDCETQTELRWAKYRITVSFDPDGLYVLKQFDWEIGNDEYPFALDNNDQFIQRINAEPVDTTDYQPWFVNQGENLSKKLNAWVGTYPGGGKWLPNGQPDLVVVSKPGWASFVESNRSLDNNSATYTFSGVPTNNDHGVQYLVVQAVSDDPTDGFTPWNWTIPIYVSSYNTPPSINQSLQEEYIINVAQNQFIQGNVSASDVDVTMNKRDTIFFDWYLWDKDSSKFHDDGVFTFNSNASSSSFKWTPTRNETGNYDLVMEAYDYYLKKDTTSSSAKIFYLEADFSCDRFVGFVPFTVKFKDESIAENTEITKWNWDFQDGKSSDLQNPIHTYNMATTFTINLEISNGTHKMKEIKSFYIIAKKVDFKADTTHGEAPLIVNFQNLVNTDLPLSITSNTMMYAVYEWNWDFGDGSTSQDYNPSHTYTHSGNYDVSLQANIYIYDDLISTTIPVDTIKSEVFVKQDYIIIAGELMANFDSDKREGYAPLEVKFTDVSSGEPESWLWNFGDGETSTVKNPTHVYDSVGVFSVSLTIKKDETENTKTITNMIKVLQALQADFSANPRKGDSPLNVQFTDESIGVPAANSWSWQFGDGGTSDKQNPMHIYANDGVYEVTLLVGNGERTDSETKTAYIKVGQPSDLKADFTAEPRTGDSPLSVQFTDISSGSPIQWVWDFGDGTIINREQNPSHIYENSGTFSVKLVVFDGTDTDSLTKDSYIIVGPLGVNDFIINSFELFQNYPNPMKESTTIKYSLENVCRISVRIFDNLGNEVKTIISSNIKPAGIHHLDWNGKDNNGKQVPSGVYYIELSVEGSNYKFSKTKEMIIIK